MMITLLAQPQGEYKPIPEHSQKKFKSIPNTTSGEG